MNDLYNMAMYGFLCKDTSFVYSGLKSTQKNDFDVRGKKKSIVFPNKTQKRISIALGLCDIAAAQILSFIGVFLIQSVIMCIKK